MFFNIFRERCRIAFKNLDYKKKLKWIYQSIERKVEYKVNFIC